MAVKEGSILLLHDPCDLAPWTPAGSVLERVLLRSGISRKHFEFKSSAQSFPRNGKLILTMGEDAFQKVLGLEGRYRQLAYARGYVYEIPDSGTRVIPTFHPSFLRGGNIHLAGVFQRDLEFALAVAQGSNQQFILNPQDDGRLQYACKPRTSDAWDFYRNCARSVDTPIAFDIETTWGDGGVDGEANDRGGEAGQSLAQDGATCLRSIQFSTRPGTGVYFPWRGEFKRVAEALLKLPNVKVGHNCWNFDLPVLRTNGLTIAGHVHDSMWMFRHLCPDLPSNLQFAASLSGFPFPWKHFAGRLPEFYGASDVDATLRLFQWLQQALGRFGLLEGYATQVFGVRSALEAISARGIPISKEALHDPKRKWRSRSRYAPDSRGRVSPRPEYSSPTGAVETRDPNIASIPLDHREVVRAGEDRVLVEFQLEVSQVAGKLDKPGVLRLADEQGALRNRYGYHREFQEAMKWDSKRQRMVRGSQAKEAEEWIEEANFAGLMKEYLGWLDKGSYPVIYMGRNCFLMEMEEARVCHAVSAFMNMLQLHPNSLGVQPTVSVTVGKHWGAMSPWKTS